MEKYNRKEPNWKYIKHVSYKWEILRRRKFMFFWQIWSKEYISQDENQAKELVSRKNGDSFKTHPYGTENRNTAENNRDDC